MAKKPITYRKREEAVLAKTIETLTLTEIPEPTPEEAAFDAKEMMEKRKILLQNSTLLDRLILHIEKTEA